MTQCRVCANELETDLETQRQICGRCVDKLNLVAMPPPRRPPSPCPRCQGTSFVRSLMREMVPVEAVSPWHRAQVSDAVQMLPIAVGLTHEIDRVPLTLGGQDVLNVGVGKPLGVLSRYTCRACGFVEVFCDDPDSVPIGPEYMTDIVEYGTSPYR